MSLNNKLRQNFNSRHIVAPLFSLPRASVKLPAQYQHRPAVQCVSSAEGEYTAVVGDIFMVGRGVHG